MELRPKKKVTTWARRRHDVCPSISNHGPTTRDRLPDRTAATNSRAQQSSLAAALLVYAACQPAASGRTTTATSVTRGLCSLGVRGVALAVRQSVARSSRINAAGRQVFDGCRSMRLRRGRPVAPARPPQSIRLVCRRRPMRIRP